MPFLEYVKPNQELRKEMADILNVGTDKGSEGGLAERAKALRNILIKWKEKLSKGFVQEINNLLKYSAVLVDSQGRPKPPHWKGYNVKEYGKVVEDAWQRLIDYYEDKESQKRLPTQNISSLFVLMADGLQKLVKRLAGQDAPMISRGGINYAMVDGELWPGHQVVEITNKDHTREFSDLSRNCKNTKEDQVKYIFHESLPKDTAGPEKKSAKEVKLPNDTKRTKK